MDASGIGKLSGLPSDQPVARSRLGSPSEIGSRSRRARHLSVPRMASALWSPACRWRTSLASQRLWSSVSTGSTEIGIAAPPSARGVLAAKNCAYPVYRDRISLISAKLMSRAPLGGANAFEAYHDYSDRHGGWNSCWLRL